MPDLPLRPDLTIFEHPPSRGLEIRLQEDPVAASEGAGQGRSLHRAGAATVRFVARCPLPALRAILAERVGPYDRIVLRLPDQPAIAAALRECRSVLVKCSHAGTRLVLAPATASTTLDEPAAGAGAPGLNAVVDEIARAIAALSRLTRRRPREHLRLRWQGPAALKTGPRRVAVAGAGIAGVTIALELLARGHEVLLLEPRGQILSASSSQPWLACHPQFARRPDLLSALTQCALLWTQDSPYAELFERRGRFTPALDDAQAREMQARVEQLALDPAMLRFISPAQARERAQWPAEGAGQTHGGLWCALGASLEVARLRQSVMEKAAAPGSRLHVLTGTRLSGIGVVQGHWHLETGRPDRLDCEALVIAAGVDTAGLLACLGPLGTQGEEPGWQCMAGQTFRVSGLEPGRQSPAATLGGALTLQRLDQGQALVGSSYYEPEQAPDDFSQWQALKALLDALPGFGAAQARILSSHAGLRAYVRDRMPMIGPLTSPPGGTSTPAPGDAEPHPPAYLAAAFGSRGLLWAHLAAGLIADHLEARLPLLGLKALESLDPLRYRRPRAQG